MLSEGRRVCLTLAALVEQARAAGVKTLTPEVVLGWIAKAAGRAVPEEILGAQERVRFHAACTVAELAQLLVQYDAHRLADLSVSAERRLAGQMPDGGISSSVGT